MNDLHDLQQKLTSVFLKLKRYLVPLFLLLLLGLYGFVVLRIQALNGAEPSATEISAQSQVAQVSHIDPKVLAQLQQLQDNSVNVQTLFDQARSSPFQE